ncbi:MAG: Gldg family protein [Halothece sp. Uz-M2-17]|nr:Gldg family protein [Halothece sp. Uz-M2-17]
MAKYLFLFGILVVIIGVTSGYVAGDWTPIPLGLIITGGVIAIISFFLGTRKFWRRRSTQANLNAFIATIALIFILGFLNFLGIRYQQTIDLTENNLFTLAPQSKQLVSALEEPLTVWVFNDPPSEETERLLNNYQKQSNNFKINFVDPQQNISKAQEFGVESYGEIYIEYGDKTQFVQQVSEVEAISEVKLTSAIQNIQRDRVSFIYILQGHGEPPLDPVQGGLSQAVTSLKQQGYQVQPFNFAEETNLPNLANSVLMIASPERALFPGEVEAIANYLAEGGSLLLLLDPDSNSGLDPILEMWGVQLDDRVIVDASGQGQVLGFNAATAFVTRYGDHPITNPFGNGISIYPLARPVDAVEKEGITATPLAYTNEASWAESDTTQEQLEYNPERDRAGPLVISFALDHIEDSSSETQQEETSDSNNSEETNAEEKETENESSVNTEETTTDSDHTEETTSNSDSETINESSENTEETESEEKTFPKPSPEARIVVFGDSDFATNGLFVQQLNGDMFLNSVDWLANSETPSLALRPKEETNRRINLTPQQAAILSRTAVGIVPLVGLILAMISWLRRR